MSVQMRFGDWRLDPDTRQLFRGNEDVHVSPKAFDLLKLLIERRPRALSKAELHAAIWPATFVSDASLAQLVSEIRTAIGDAAHEPKFLRTVHGFGYAFAGDPTEVRPMHRGSPTGALYWLRIENRDIQLQHGENVLGRDATATVRLESLRISRYHARIVLNEEEAILEDLGSKNGTFLHGERIAEPARLGQGDQIRVGPFSLTFHVSRPGATTETEVQGGR
jgi:DNA-binding winged helix-turn-helix (wHTH) protein